MTYHAKDIFVQDSVAYPNQQRGVNRYFLKFLEILSLTFFDKLLVFTSRNLNAPSAKIITAPSKLVPDHFSFRLNAFLKKIDTPLVEVLANITSQIYYSPYFGQASPKIPQVYTVPDLIYEKFPIHFPPSDPIVHSFLQEKKKCFERAALLLPISQSAAQDMMEIYPRIPHDRIRVVYLGVEDVFFTTSLEAPKKGKPYFLYVGNRSLYKNFTAFLQAFGKSGLARDFDLHIVSPVGSEYTVQEQAIILQNGLIDHIKLKTAISDQQLRDQYHNAHAFVYPSEYEGFGFPVPEALASGTLVVTSGASSMPEIGGEAPIYFNPLSIDSMITALLSVSRISNTERQIRIETGRKRAAQFTWQASQAGFLAAVQSLL